MWIVTKSSAFNIFLDFKIVLFICLLEMFFRHFIKVNMTEWMNSHIWCSLASRINKLKRYCYWIRFKILFFFKTWNSLLSNNGSLNYSLISWFFLSLKNFRVVIKNTNHPVIRCGKTLRISSLPNVKTEYLTLITDF